MGIVLVARRAGSTMVEDMARITSTFIRTSWAASSGSCSTLSTQRNSKDNILALDVTEVAQAPLQRLHPARLCRSGPEVQKSD